MPPAAVPEWGSACQNGGGDGAAVAAGGAASFSACGRYRWWLARRWRGGRGRLLFIGLNPSRADHHQDDASLRRLAGFARAWGFAELEVLNLFARIAVQPRQLREAGDPVGSENEAWLNARLREQARHWGPGPPPVWLGWGNHGGWRGRDRQVLELVRRLGGRPAWLGLTAIGQPRHPLYVPRRTQLLMAGPSWAERCHAPLPSWPVSPVATPFT